MSKYIGCIILLVLPFIGSTQTENYWTKKSDFAGLKRERAVAFSIGDYGYVGTGPGKIHLYKEKEVVRKNIPEDEAVDALIELIREHGDWIAPNIES
jgi:hypothetical protein